MRRFVSLLAIIAAIATVPARVHADAVVGSAPPETTHYYRDILAVDGTAAGLFLAGAVTIVPCIAGDDEGWSCDAFMFSLIGAGGTYAFGGPLIHLAEGEPGRAAASLALRTGLPLGGLLIGQAVDDELTPWAFLGGMIGAVAIDYAMATKPAGEIGHTALAPTVAPARGGATLGLAGVF